MRRKQKVVETAVGWRDLHPDLTSGEHDTLVAMVELAWHDVQINLGTVPESRREEALAAKISAWEWFTKEPEEYIEDGENPPRISFRAACLHLGLHEERVRWSCLNRGWRPPHDVLLEPICSPDAPMPDEWREQFIGPDDPERHREERAYAHSAEFYEKREKRKKAAAAATEAAAEAVTSPSPQQPAPQPLQPPPAAAAPAPAHVPAVQPVQPVQAVQAAQTPTREVVMTSTEKGNDSRKIDFCADLDEELVHGTLNNLVKVVEPEAPAKEQDVWARWNRGLVGTEEDD